MLFLLRTSFSKDDPRHKVTLVKLFSEKKKKYTLENYFAVRKFIRLQTISCVSTILIFKSTVNNIIKYKSLFVDRIIFLKGTCAYQIGIRKYTYCVFHFYDTKVCSMYMDIYICTSEQIQLLFQYLQSLMIKFDILMLCFNIYILLSIFIYIVQKFMYKFMIYIVHS